jgi:hypothetical protein
MIAQVYKMARLLHAYSLEMESTKLGTTRTRSILVDMGTEKGVWCHFESDPTTSTLRLTFPLALPLPDGDHALHHVLALLFISVVTIAETHATTTTMCIL